MGGRGFGGNGREAAAGTEEEEEFGAETGKATGGGRGGVLL